MKLTKTTGLVAVALLALCAPLKRPRRRPR